MLAGFCRRRYAACAISFDACLLMLYFAASPCQRGAPSFYAAFDATLPYAMLIIDAAACR